MTTFIERLETEKSELDDKISKARELIDTNINSLEVKQQQEELNKAFDDLREGTFLQKHIDY